MMCTKGMALKLLLVGLVLILVRVYTAWDIWIVVGVIMIIKAILLFLMKPEYSDMKSKKKR